MSRRWFGDGKTLEYIAPGVVNVGDVIAFPHVTGIALTAATLAGQKVIVAMEGVWEMTKFSADAFTQGDAVGWLAGLNRVDFPGVGTPLGTCWKDAPSGSGTKILIRLNFGGVQ